MNGSTQEYVAAVGSQNPVKRRAVEQAASDIGIARVISAGVDSGVSAQPLGHGETYDGATNRALEAYRQTDVDLGIGIEGGVGIYPDVNGTFVIMWAAIADEDRVTPAAGPGIPLPDRIAERVEDGKLLGDVIANVAGPESKERGAAGVLTDDVIDREAALCTTVRTALGRHLANKS